MSFIACKAARGTAWLVGMAGLLLLPLRATAQEEFGHPELEWHTLETAHFFVHYHDGAERTARVVAKVAEDVYPAVTALYQHEPDSKVSFIIKDYDDISNGAAYFYDNKIELFAPSMDFEFRGTHNWLRNVVTHEFTHIVQIQTAMKFGRRFPSIYFQWLGYESERRPDVLYGYPNVIVSYPLSGFVVPVWFAEGVAQYNRTDLRYDFWDSHRDMILRSYALEGKMLTWEQMSVFGKTSLGNESSYNAGFAFVSYIARTYGEEKLNAISRRLASLPVVTIDAAIEYVLGKQGGEVYAEWRASVERDYATRVAAIRGNLREGIPFVPEDEKSIVNPGQLQRQESFLAPHSQTGLTSATQRGSTPQASEPPLGVCTMNAEGTGFANLYPTYAPDGKRIAYVSAKGGDYFGLSSLYVYDFTTNTEVLVAAGVRTAPCWSADGTALYYGRATRSNPHWSYQHDLYRYDLKEKDETRLTHGLRALSPSMSPDGKSLACLVTKDGTTNIAVLRPDGTGFRQVTAFVNGEQAYNPKWLPDGSRIVFDYSIRDGRDIGWVRPEGGTVEFLVWGPDDSRCGVPTPDGKRLVFSSDRTGIFNLYSLDLATREVAPLTNVLGGAFYPTVNAEGDIVYAAYTAGGYKMVRMAHAEPLAENIGRYAPVAEAATPGAPAETPAALAAKAAEPQFDWNALRHYDDTMTPGAGNRSYKSTFTRLSIVPFVRIDNYNTSSDGLDMIKPGVYLFSNDVLEKTGFFAGAAINKRLERDLFLQFFYRGRIPLLYQLGLEPRTALELYSVSRKTDTRVSLPDRDPFKVDVTYDLFEFDFAFSQPVLSQFDVAELRYAHSRYSSSLGSFSNTITGDLVSASSDQYLIANTVTFTYTLDAIVPSSTSEINPVGSKLILKASREFNKFGATDSAGYRKYELSSTGLKSVYDQIDFTRLEMSFRQHLASPINGHTLTVKLRGGTILGGPVDDFFDFYLGGLIGMKGYPFYGLSGNSYSAVGLEYRFPLVSNIDLRLGHVYFDKLYASIYGDLGNAWTASKPRLGDFKKDIGAEIRLEAFSFYSYPTRIFVNASYGLDKFSRFIRTRNETVTYGKEWRFYLGVLFGFDME